MKSIIVVGGGILGASTTYHLAKKGIKVTLIDRQEPGQATNAAAGIICPWLSQRRNKAWYQLAKSGAAYYKELISMLEEDGEIETGYKRVGAISIHNDDEKLEKMEKRAVQRRSDAPEIGEITRLTQEETQNLFPVLSNEYSALHISGGARVDGSALCSALISAAKKHGAELRFGNASLLTENNQITGVRVHDEELFADKVILTAGAWASELLIPLGINFLITSQKAQIIHLKIDDLKTDTWPVVMPPNDQYILSFNPNKIVVGATHENNIGFNERITAGGIHEILDKALKVAPGLAAAEIVETRVGFRPFTPGFLPVIGKIPGTEGMLLANGLGASGLTVGPYLGAELAKLALDINTEIDLSLYPVEEALGK
ncbi:FAD-binding oxidoreductase [Jeotgalibacillus sp. S-D1]|uniref:NAD(P)/FAD-dependent oxidoreductase n=1 Tax=Jeotgalibacillus sp. S-D1 TaxID=2552189 RepID=UPI0010597E63|nr:FAD-dependent oxidoreductase [Jeotgalibacillus sp. S-D1]TDL35282.1 FAD-binding oxidoreductase [Jeotgalibacillus sp. S-D1]